MTDSVKKTKLAEADTAIYGLLETLLSEVDPIVEQVEIKPEKVLKKTEKRTITEVVEAEPLVVEVEKTVAIEELSSKFPEWGEQEFTALIFVIKDMKFAVPLVTLNSIMPFPERLTKIPGQPDWHLGVTTHRGQQIVAVDVHKLLGFSSKKVAVEDKGYLLVIGDGGYGIHCEVIDTPVKLMPNEVKWTTDTEKKAWLAGMLPEHMCALLNIDGVIATMFAVDINN